MYEPIEWVYWVGTDNHYTKSHAFIGENRTALCGTRLPPNALIPVWMDSDFCLRCEGAVSKRRAADRQEMARITGGNY